MAAGQSATGHWAQNCSLTTPLNSDKLRAGPAGLLSRTRETRAFQPPHHARTLSTKSFSGTSIVSCWAPKRLR